MNGYEHWRYSLDDWRERLAQRQEGQEEQRKKEAEVLRLEQVRRDGVEYSSWRDSATSTQPRNRAYEHHSPGLNSSAGSGAVTGTWRERSHNIWREATGAGAGGAALEADREWHLALQKNVEAVRAARRQREEASFRDRAQSGRIWSGHPDIMMRMAGPAWRDLNQSRVRHWRSEQEQRNSERVQRVK
mmetsp:Transcript_26897/g.47557  ORF Transcript_26897/g.47557 Transcript_26897/m.47557 type:complete len:188 (+) Transcript_26897:2-565(+)